MAGSFGERAPGYGTQPVAAHQPAAVALGAFLRGVGRVEVLAKPCVVKSSAAASSISSRAVAPGREGCWWRGRPGPAEVTAPFLHCRARRK